MNFILRKTRFTFLRMSKMERIRERIKGKGKEREEVIIMIMILSNKGGKKMDDKSPWCLDRIKGEARFARKKLYHVVRRRPSQPYCAAKRLGCRRLCSSQPPLSLFCRGKGGTAGREPSRRALSLRSVIRAPLPSLLIFQNLSRSTRIGWSTDDHTGPLQNFV